MSVEFWNAVATWFTAIIIAATAIAALVQLRHVGNNNRITAVNSVRDFFISEKFTDDRRLVHEQVDAAMQDPAFRWGATHFNERTHEQRVVMDPLLRVGNFWEHLGIQAKNGFLDESVVEIFCQVAKDDWEKLEPFIALLRRDTGEGTWENFEYFVALANEWMLRHPHGLYPKGAKRLPCKDVWAEADAKLARDGFSGDAAVPAAFLEAPKLS